MGYGRNSAEAGNHAFKAFLGDQTFSKQPTAQRNEILSMSIAYNLARLLYLGVGRDIQIPFAGGARWYWHRRIRRAWKPSTKA